MSEVETPLNEDSITMTTYTAKHFLRRLEERVSGYNAKLLLHAALVDSGIVYNSDEKLDSDQAKNLCLSLIKKGGPAFQVGQNLYREMQQ